MARPELRLSPECLRYPRRRNRSWQEALLSSEQHRGTIQLLLSDVVMPQMSGQPITPDTLTRKVREVLDAAAGPAS